MFGLAHSSEWEQTSTIAFRGIGASEVEVARIPDMSIEELCDWRRKVKADPSLQAYIHFWGNALPDEILYFLQRWNSWTRAG